MGKMLPARQSSTGYAEAAISRRRRYAAICAPSVQTRCYDLKDQRFMLIGYL